MFLFVRLFAALMVVVPCYITFDGSFIDYDDYPAAVVPDRLSKYYCPNDQCIDSRPKNVTEPMIMLVHFHLNRLSFDCCKLSGLQQGDYIGRRYHEVPQDVLRRLIIDDGRVESIPMNLITRFEPLIFEIINGILKTLTIADFTGATRLTEFNATHNRIEQLEPNTFVFAPNLESIDLSNNRIAEVSEYAFENIPKLEVLILSNNLITKLVFKSTLISLRVFMVSNNSLTHLNENVFAQSIRLTDIGLNNNTLNISKLNVGGNLDSFDMSDNPGSIYLNAKYIRIRNSNVKVLNISKMAKRIDASDNQISSIVVHPENGLIELILSRNNYTTMQNLTVLKSIENLDLSFNQINDIDLTSFSHMSQLKSLNLENSGLKAIDFGMFAQQQSLNWLDISYNNLREINFNMLTSSIYSLYIEGNELTTIDVSDIEITLPNIRLIGLSNNKFNCEKLIEIRKVLAAHSVEMFVDEQLMVKYSRNINGIGCSNKNSTETMALNPTKLLPIHTNHSDQNQFIESIHRKINEIETNIRQHSDSLNENSIDSKSDLLSVKQELMNIRNDGEVKIDEVKSDILLTISGLFNVSTNGTNVSVDLKSTVEELNRINLERYQTLSLELKMVKDKLQDLGQSVANLKSGETFDGQVFHLKQNAMSNGDADVSSSRDLVSLKNMMTFVVVAVISLISGFSVVLFYKRFYKNKRRYISSNTIDTNVDQSLV